MQKLELSLEVHQLFRKEKVSYHSLQIHSQFAVLQSTKGTSLLLQLRLVSSKLMLVSSGGFFSVIQSWVLRSTKFSFVTHRSSLSNMSNPFSLIRSGGVSYPALFLVSCSFNNVLCFNYSLYFFTVFSSVGFSNLFPPLILQWPFVQKGVC